MSYRYSNAKYMTIAECIARRLRAGDFMDGEPFYSRDELARAYNISPGTARAVLRVLEDRGVIACRKGKRPVPAGVMADPGAAPACRPVFFRDAFIAETPEYDYLAYCVRNILMRGKNCLREHDSDLPELADYINFSAGEIAVVFPSAGSTAAEPAAPGWPEAYPAYPRIDLLIDRKGSNAVSVFTHKAGPDCALHLIRQNTAAIVHVESAHSAFPWFRHISEPVAFRAYLPGCETFNVVFKDELEAFPVFLTESVSVMARGRAPVAVLIDDPYLSDYLSGEIRSGAYHPPSWCSLFGTAFNERSMVFPYLDLRLNELASTIIRTASSKTENPAADLACEFHLIQFRTPGIG